VSAPRSTDPVERVRALVEGARIIADRTSSLGSRARSELVRATGLSLEGVELALAECLETHVSEREIADFCAGVEPVERSLVLLSANVFVAAHRALALGLAGSARVMVRPSRREPVFARLLAEAAPGLFEIVAELAPAPGDAVWAYGSDETLDAVRKSLPAGVRFHAHGSGIGVAVVDALNASRDAARALALDVVPFDQRGCLSPRAVVFVGSDAEAHGFARLVAEELAALSRSVPLGTLDSDEAADATRFRDAVTVAGAVFPAGPGTVGVGGARLVVAPVGRNLHVVPCDDPTRLLGASARSIAALGIATEGGLAARLREALLETRPSALGRMQRPPFDGPVDRRRG